MRKAVKPTGTLWKRTMAVHCLSIVNKSFCCIIFYLVIFFHLQQIMSFYHCFCGAQFNLVSVLCYMQVKDKEYGESDLLIFKQLLENLFRWVVQQSSNLRNLHQWQINAMHLNQKQYKKPGLHFKDSINYSLNRWKTRWGILVLGAVSKIPWEVYHH